MHHPTDGPARLALGLLLAAVLCGADLLVAQAPSGHAAEPRKVVISSNPGESDQPALCADAGGSAWAVWQAYEGGADRLYAARWERGRWGRPVPVSGVRGDLHDAVCGVDGERRLHVVWAQQEDADWDLWSTTLAGKSWAPPARIAGRAGTDFSPRLAATAAGSLLLVWQAWRGDNFDVLLASHSGGRWSHPEVVTASPGNDWAPAVAVSPAGVVSVAWDSYRNGSYDVYLRQREGGRWSDEVLVAGSARFEANATLAADADERVWIAYEERGERWGKDRGYVTTPGFDETNTLLGFSRARVKVLHRGRLLQPVQPPEQLPVHREWGGDRSPTLAVSPTGHVWLALKRPDPEWMQLWSFKRQIPFAGWQPYATVFDGDRWSAPLRVDSMLGRSDSGLGVAPLPDGRLLQLWHSDHRGGRWHNMPSSNRVYGALLEAPDSGAVPPRLGPSSAGVQPEPVASGAREQAEVRRAREYRATVPRGDYRLLRGDLHRHTDMSWDGPSEGSIGDLFRYALDAAALDFVAVTDHSPPPGIEIEYVRWRTQKITDLFHAPPHFIPLFGYERSLQYPFGHRNIIEAERGHAPFPIPRPFPPDDTERLYRHVHGTGGIVIPHTTGTDHGTDWHVHDAHVEPVVEIYQGTRTSYEHEGAPRADDPRSQQALETGYRPDGFVWEAWKKGYRLGVIASSDHLATHVAYANVFAPVATREGLIEAMRARHTFASTDNIILDFRAGDHLQGEDVQAAAPPRFRIRVHGTAPLRDVVLFRNFQVAHRAHAGGAQTDLTWTDPDPQPGTSHYYVRVEQEDGELAWSSPIWVTLKR